MDTRPAKLTLWPGVGLVSANMIGAGVFLSAGFMAQEMGPGAILLAWVAGAALALAGARAYAELARLVPRSGGEYRYLTDLVHPSLGFLAGWASLLVGFSAPVAANALAAGAFAKTVFPGLSPAWTGAAFVVALTGIHAAGLRVSEGSQNLLALAKVVLFAGFIGVGLAFGSNAWPAWAAPGAVPGAGFPWGAFGRSLFFIAFAFSGWNAAVYAAEEFDRPAKTVPRAMMIGTLGVAALYLVVNWVFVANLTPADATVVFRYDSEQVTLGHAVVQRLLGEGSGRVMSLVTVVVFLSAMSAMIFVGPRVYAAMAKDGFLPAVLAGEDGKPPVASVVLQGVIALAMVFTNPLRDVLSRVGAVLTLLSGLTAAGLFVAAVRAARDPRADRPGPLALLCAAVYAGTAAALIGYDLFVWKGSFGWIAVVTGVGLGAYGLSRPWRRVPAAAVEPPVGSGVVTAVSPGPGPSSDPPG